MLTAPRDPESCSSRSHPVWILTDSASHKLCSLQISVSPSETRRFAYFFQCDPAPHTGMSPHQPLSRVWTGLVQGGEGSAATGGHHAREGGPGPSCTAPPSWAPRGWCSLKLLLPGLGRSRGVGWGGGLASAVSQKRGGCPGCYAGCEPLSHSPPRAASNPSPLVCQLLCEEPGRS